MGRRATGGEGRTIRRAGRRVNGFSASPEWAVQAVLENEWSQGQVEGQVHRLKLVKRAMYGRGKFDLLRAQVLHTT